MKRILFVDDESKVLAGLRRMLRGLRREWDMEFVESGGEALTQLAERPFDVVVTDMRMPGMDGSELLDAVRRKHPGTARMVLSGQCDRDSTMKAVGLTHQFLTKPCDSEVLKATVARACDLRDRLPDRKSRQMVSFVQSLPSRQATFEGLMAELRSASPSIQRLGEIVSADVGMTAKVLQLVSSGFFGSPQRVADASQAVHLLGVETIRALVLGTEIVFALEPGSPEADALEELNQHSLAVAAAAKQTAQAETDNARIVGEAWLSGLLHNVGAVVLLTSQPRRYLEVLSEVRRGRVSLGEAEKEAFNTSHRDVGAYLLGLWGLPDSIVQAMAFHPGPQPGPYAPVFTGLHAERSPLLGQ